MSEQLMFTLERIESASFWTRESALEQLIIYAKTGDFWEENGAAMDAVMKYMKRDNFNDNDCKLVLKLLKVLTRTHQSALNLSAYDDIVEFVLNELILQRNVVCFVYAGKIVNSLLNVDPELVSKLVEKGVLRHLVADFDSDGDIDSAVVSLNLMSSLIHMGLSIPDEQRDFIDGAISCIMLAMNNDNLMEDAVECLQKATNTLEESILSCFSVDRYLDRFLEIARSENRKAASCMLSVIGSLLLSDSAFVLRVLSGCRLGDDVIAEKVFELLYKLERNEVESAPFMVLELFDPSAIANAAYPVKKQVAMCLCEMVQWTTVTDDLDFSTLQDIQLFINDMLETVDEDSHRKMLTGITCLKNLLSNQESFV